MPLQTLPRTGTYEVNDLLGIETVTAAELGLDNIADAIRRYVGAWNGQVGEMMALLANQDTRARGVWGGQAEGKFREVEEYASSRTQKSGLPLENGWPIRKYDYTVGWTFDYLQTASAARIAQQTLQVRAADLANLRYQIARAIFRATEYPFVDKHETRMSYKVKPFLNGDTDVPPISPEGTTFATAHNHYNAENGLTAAGLWASVLDLIEHGHGDDVRIWINEADEAAVSALTGYLAIQPGVVQINQGTTVVGALDTSRVTNRRVGYFKGIPVETRPWVPANYAWVFSAGDMEKPLRFRQRAAAALQGLRLQSSEKAHPLFVDAFERWFGVGVNSRTNGVVHYWGAGTYAEPSL